MQGNPIHPSVDFRPPKNMNVLLLYPSFPETFWGFKHALRFIRKKASLPPLGLLTVASMLPPTWHLRLVDLNVRSLTKEDLDWADLAMISAMIAQKETTKALIARCHEAGLTVVAGGPLFTGEPDTFPEVEHLVLGEAEVSLAPFIEDYLAGKARHRYEATRLPEVKESPVPAWPLVKLANYASACVQYSRGCPFDCEFCSVTAMFGHRPRVKSATQIIAELGSLWEHGWRGTVFFVDDNLIGNKRALKEELLPALLQWRKTGRNFNFYTEASINLADDEELTAMMVAAGFDQVFVGIETPAADGLKECHKVQNQGRNLLADIQKLQNAGLEVQGGFIVGFDADEVSIFQRQLDFIQKSGIVTAMVGILQTLPGTKLHDRLRQEGRLLAQPSGNNSDGTIDFITRMNPEVLRTGYRHLMENLYRPGAYYQRANLFLSRFRGRLQGNAFSFGNLLAFSRASVRLGILGRERFHYWWFLLRTLLLRPGKFSLAVKLAILGFHFRQCCRRLLGSIPEVPEAAPLRRV